MQKFDAHISFMCPFGCTVVGPNMSGESHFILEFLRKEEFFSPTPSRVVYAYGIWQEAFEKAESIEFVKGVEGLSGVEFNSKQPSNLIIDDLMEELCDNRELSTLFRREMHNKNITVFFLSKIYISRVRACGMQQ